jgi:hypothetical protein
MKIVGLGALGCFLFMGVLVGTRLLLLARRTRGAPEFCAGLGLLCLTLLAHPFSAAARLPALLGTGMGDALFAIGMATTAAGITLIYAFTWRVFRPGQTWAAALVALGAVASAILCAGLQISTHGASGIEEVLPRARPWTIGVTLTLAGAYTWTAVEGLLYHGKLRRRHALGLADPVVANRVWLWAMSGVAATLMLTTVAWFAWHGALVLHDPAALLATAGAGLATGVCWYLAFLPPDAYLAWLQRRAA